MLLALGVVLLSGLAIIGANAGSEITIHTQIGQMYVSMIRPTFIINQVSQQLSEHDQMVNDYVETGGNINSAVIRESMLTCIARVNLLLEDLRHADPTQDELTNQENFERLWQEYASSTLAVIDIAEKGNWRDAHIQFSRTRSMPSAMNAILTGMVEYNEREGRLYYHESLSFHNHIEWILAGLTGILVASGIAAVILIQEAVERESLMKSKRMYQMLSRANQSLAQNQTEEALLAECCSIVHTIGGYKMVWIGLIGKENPYAILPAAHIGFPEAFVLGFPSFETGKGPAARAALLREPIIARNEPADPSYEYWHGDATLEGFTSVAAFPLMHHGSLIGTLSIYSYQAKAFQPDEMNLLMNLANNLAFGIVALRGKKTIEANEHKLQAIFDNHFVLSALLDPAGRFIAANNAALDMEDVTIEQIVGRFFWDSPWWQHSAEEQAKVQALFLQLVASGGKFAQVETTHLDVDGRLHNIEISMRPVLDQAGNLSYVVLEGHDFTERKQMEEALENERHVLQAVLEHMPAGLLLVDAATGNLILTNSYCEHLFGQQYKLAVDQGGRLPQPVNLYRQGTDSPYPMDERPVPRALRGEEVKVDDLELRRPDGEVILLEASSVPLYDLDGNITAAIAVFQDITARKKMELSLQESMRRLQRLIDALPVGLHFYRADEGRLILEGANPAASRILNGDLSRYFGKTMEEAFPGLVNTCIPEIYRKIAVRGGIWSEPQIEYHAGEISGAFDVIAFQNEPNHMAAIFMDVTDRRRSEETIQAQLKQQALLRVIDQIIIENHDLQRMSSALLVPVREFFGADAVEILILDAQCHLLHQIAGLGFLNPELAGKSLPENTSDCLGIALSQKRMVWVPDTACADIPLVDPCEFYQTEQVRSCMVVPLVTQTDLQGVLQLFYRRPHLFSERDQGFIQTIANQLAIAIEKSILWEQLQTTLGDLVAAYETTLEGWIRALDMRDKETEDHTLRVVDLTIQTARRMGLGEAEIAHIRRGALLHDIGKMGIPDAILNKPAPLNEAEWDVMRRHPILAYEMLSQIEFLKPAVDIPYCHHERWDGEGYPRGLKGEAIPLPARIFAVVDVWDALVSDRVYRKALEPEDALKLIISESGKQFDPDVITHFIEVMKPALPSPDHQEAGLLGA